MLNLIVLAPGIGHTDNYRIFWGYANIGAGGTLVTNLTGVHAVPEPLTLLGVGTALSFGTYFKRKFKKQ